MNMTICEMSASHLDAVCALEAACFSPPWSKTAFLFAMQNSLCLCALAEDGSVAGYLVFSHVTDEGELQNICTAPAYRRLGVGQALLSKLLSRAAALGVSRIFLEVRKSNTAAISLYEKNGFEAYGIRQNYYSHPKEDAVLMKRIS